MLYTGRFANKRMRSGEYLAVPICLWLPKFRPKYPLERSIRELAPKQSYLRRPRDEYTHLYLTQLEQVGAERVESLLQAVRVAERDTVLLCYEDLRKSELWCHRRLFADWWLGQTGEVIPELEEDQLALL